MDRIEKFLKLLETKRAKCIRSILPRIRSLELNGLDVKKMKGHENVYRIRVGKIRIVFIKEKKVGIIIDIDFRENIY